MTKTFNITEPIEQNMRNTLKTHLNPNDFIKNPTVLEFLNLPTNKSYTEAELEKGLMVF